MIEVVETEAGLRAVDADKNEVSIRAPDWVAADVGPRIDRPVQATVGGRTSSLGLPEGAVCIQSATRDRWQVFGSGTGPLRLPDDVHVAKVEANIATYARFEGRATIHRRSKGGPVIFEFPEPTPVTLGFRSRVRRPTATIEVPPTTAGLAAAVPHLGRSVETTSPDRSFPSMRPHPPLVDVTGDETLEGKGSGSPNAPDTGGTTGIRFRIPASLEAVFVAAPLSYYLQAELTPESGATPALEVSDRGRVREFGPFDRFQHGVADVLRRVFLLDCLVREAGPFRTDLAEVSLLEDVGLDPDRLYAASLPERLVEYLDAPFEAIEASLPDWHLATHVEPTLDHARTLPHLLDRLSLIYLPRAGPLGRGELLERSLDEFYRSTGDPQSTDAATSREPLLADLRRGRVNAWMADGVPIDVFKTLPEAFENRLEYLKRPDGTKTVTVVLNDPGMDDEQSAVAEIYRERAEDLSMEVTIERDLARDELAAVFERPTDFVHFIGHCESSGLECPDGNLSAADIDESRAQTFFLNSCGSIDEGMALIRKGSVAGAVTLDKVLDEQATRVGTTFARLVMNGYCMEQAMQLARRRAILNKNYLVVGDGTYVLVQGNDCYPPTTRIESRSNKTYKMTTQISSLTDPGGCYQSYLNKEGKYHLWGTEISEDMPKYRILECLRRATEPIVYDGEYYWSDELLDKLSN